MLQLPRPGLLPALAPLLLQVAAAPLCSATRPLLLLLLLPVLLSW